ncbi:2-hydroxyacid dehydrogenase [Chitinophagaceae bacterium LB-8]|uniref:2-hydroxyacid dehydrogenase n=1 Tax=Paraflavisolibacter caeni TaxID=2982496 RepID=A0A9X3BI88_9BACT|nr:2-hydroxyacid dehydrogenase [Paraflavisolibacter caeni]MCU7550912.1 2-hydroxyacid dehydrogenase [Paraflavisolibacter caeni]
MKVSFFSAQPYDKEFFTQHNKHYGFELEFFDVTLDAQTVGLVQNATAVCVFVNDKVTADVIKALAVKGVKVLALRCAGFNNVDLQAANNLGMRVCRVPAYSPEAVAEHTVAMILTLNRKTHKAYNRVREQNFSLQGLMGFDLHNKTIGIIGTGRIGQALCRIMKGFGCRILAFDLIANKDMEREGVEYVPLITLLQQSDIISLHTPLNEQTRHLVNKETLAFTKRGVMIINTGRGGLIHTKDVIDALKSGHIGYLGVDVYEQEEGLFFRDLSSDIIIDDMIQRLMSFPNVLVTAHQAFFTKEAMDQIAETTLYNIKAIMENKAAELSGMLV